MSQLFHCLMLLYIVFVIAEIRNVLIDGNPHNPQPITIWDEVQPQPKSDGPKLTYAL